MTDALVIPPLPPEARAVRDARRASDFRRACRGRGSRRARRRRTWKVAA